DQVARELDQLALIDARENVRRTDGGHEGLRLLLRKGQDDGVEPDDAVLLELDVEVVALDLFGALLERHDGLGVGHLTEGVSALVESVAARDDLAVTDRRALRAVDANVRRRLGHHADEQIDAIDLDGDRAHGRHDTTSPPSPGAGAGGSASVSGM